jgi:hypothetical protein
MCLLQLFIVSKLYTDSLYKHDSYDSSKKPEEIEIETRGRLFTSFLLQGIKAFSLFTIVGIIVKLIFYSSTELKSFLTGYGWSLLIIFSLISSSRFKSGNTLASGVLAGTGSGPMVNAEVSYMRKNRSKVSVYYLWLLLYGLPLVIIAVYFI